jgi:cystathionine beta-lyase
MCNKLFDEIIERRGSGCVKWDEAPAADIIPLWVADMDFAVAPAIQEAVRRRAAHPVFGYTHVGEDYYEAVISWFRRRHKWEIHREEILYTTGVVPAMSVALKALTMPGEKVVMLSPDYNCFFSSIRNNGCEVVESALVRGEGEVVRGERSEAGERGTIHFEVDWDDFESKCADEKTTVFLLCNPHNPTGRVWTADELRRMNDICLRHGVRVVSDEIHCELMMPGHRFQPFAAVSDECRRNCVALTSPSKAFNIAGLQTANIICADAEVRRRLDRAININEVCDLNPFGPVALMAAYNESEEWLDLLNGYLWENYCALRQFFAERLPQCRVTDLEGTYLTWIDVTQLLPLNVTLVGADSSVCPPHTAINKVAQLCDYLKSTARVWVNPGTMYGPETGEGYIRINIACPRSQLMEGLNRIADALRR